MLHVSIFKNFEYNTLKLNKLEEEAPMKANFKLAPISCHCKLSVLIPHLKSLSAMNVATAAIKKADSTFLYSGELFQRYI